MVKSALILLCIAVLSSCEEVDWNNRTDAALERYNDRLRNSGQSTSYVRVGRLSPEVEAKSCTLIGLDSLVRTGNCTMSKEDNKTTYDLRFGLKFLVVICSDLVIKGQRMSAVFRAKENAFSLRVAVTKEHRRCGMVIDSFRLANLSSIQMWASKEDFDGKEVSGFLDEERIVERVNCQLRAVNKSLSRQIKDSVCNWRSPEDPQVQFPLIRD